MYSGFEFNQDQKASGAEYQQQKRFSEAPKQFGTGHEHKHLYNFKAPPFEEPAEGFQIPSQLLELFEPKDKASLENKNKMASRTSVTSRSTVDSRTGNTPMNFYNSNVGSTGNVGAAGENVNPNNSGVRFTSFNTLLNQSNDYMLVKNVPNDLNTSNISNSDSRKMSLNNLSRDSANNSRIDLNTSNSRRNTSSRANPKTSKNYQVTLNEDISLIERIEIMLNQITMNHNKSCPFCSKIIDIKKCNFQNISAFLSTTSKKYYLTHFDCYLKSNSNPASAKIVPLTNVIEARVNSQINSLSSIDTSNFLRSDRRAYFVSIEGYHPISSFLFFRIDKICHGLEHASHRNQLLYLNLTNKTSSIFEPSSYMIPFSEFRLIITIHMSHANEDPYTYEYLVDFSQVKLSVEQKSKFAEVLCHQEGNSALIGAQIIYDANSELSNNLNYKMNLDSSFQSTSSTSSAKPDFGKNVFISFKHFSINLPLKRIERRTKEAQITPVVEENLFTQPKQTVQKKPHTRLQLNPNAPLFSNTSAQSDQPSGQPFIPVQTQQSLSGGFSKQQGFEPQQTNKQPPGFESGSFNPNANNFPGFNSNMFFNSSQSGQNDQQALNAAQHNIQSQSQDYASFMRGQGIQNQLQHQSQGNISGEMMPPGLGLGVQGGSNPMSYPNYPQFQNQLGGDIKNRNPNIESRPNQNFLGFQNTGFSRNIEEAFEGSHEGQNKPVLPPEDHFKEENQYQDEGIQEESNYENYQPGYMHDKEPTMMERRGNRPANLYTAVLSGRKGDNSIPNSPSLQNMQSRYFPSAVSTPRSAHAPNTPLSQSNNDFLGDDDGSNPPLSEDMIESFRLEDHLGELVEFAKTYNGSRILQKFFPKANQNEVELVIQEIEDKLEELMLDPYANYMFQTLAQSCSADQRYFLLKKIAPSMVEIACDRKGTHSLQSLIALVSRDIEEQLLRDTLQDHIVELSFDPQGTHLIQKLIVSISLNNIDFVFEPLVDRFVEVANHSFGLCVLKQLITKVDKVPELKRRLVKLLYDNLENLIQNPYGNYALQHALDTFPNECNVLFEKTFDRIVQYSNQKFSSNVIEKGLVIASPDFKKRFVKELTKNDRIIELMKNKYGNFVLLKALKAVDIEGRQTIMQNILKNLNLVSMAKYRNSWSKFIEENPLRVPGMNTSQPTKPSLFRHNSGQSEGSNEKEGPESSSPKSFENRTKEAPKKGVKDIREEKSQFYRTSNTQNFGGSGGDFEKEMRSGYVEEDLSENRESRTLKENMQEGRITGDKMGGNKEASNMAGKKGNKKFYDDKNQHYQENKWGFNNFY